MYKVYDYGTPEYFKQEIEKASKKFELAIRGLVHMVNENPTIVLDLETMSEVVSDLNDMRRNYEDAVEWYQNKFSEEE